MPYECLGWLDKAYCTRLISSCCVEYRTLLTREHHHYAANVLPVSYDMSPTRDGQVACRNEQPARPSSTADTPPGVSDAVPQAIQWLTTSKTISSLTTGNLYLQQAEIEQVLDLDVCANLL